MPTKHFTAPGYYYFSCPDCHNISFLYTLKLGSYKLTTFTNDITFTEINFKPQATQLKLFPNHAMA